MPPAAPAVVVRHEKRLSALGWSLTASLLFAVMNLLGRVAGTHEVPWQMIGFTRALAGVVVSYAVVRGSGAPILVVGSRALWMRSIFGTVAMGLTFFVLGSNRIALGDAATLFNLMPIFVAVLAPVVLGERSGVRLLVALPIALGGVLLVVKPPALFGHHGEIVDAAAVTASLAAALFASFAMLGLRRVGPRESAESIALHFSATGALVLGVLTLPVFTMPSARDAALMIVGGVCAGLAQIAMTKAYTLERAARVASYGYANVLFTALFGTLLLGELPDGLAVFGMALVLVAGVVVTGVFSKHGDATDPARGSVPDGDQAGVSELLDKEEAR